MGNNYRVKSQYHGGYPNGYLKRVKLLFPDKQRVLHLFSGKVDLSIIPGDTVDVNPDLEPTYLDSAHTLLKVPLHQYDLILCDPPYTMEDAERYGTTAVKRNRVFEALQRTVPGTHIVWLDQMFPMHRKDFFRIDGVVGLVRSTQHRMRLISIFERTELVLRRRIRTVSQPINVAESSHLMAK